MSFIQLGDDVIVNLDHVTKVRKHKGHVILYLTGGGGESATTATLKGDPGEDLWEYFHGKAKEGFGATH